MRYAFKQITDSYTVDKKAASTIWAKLVTRRISYLTTYILINLGFTANAVSVIAMLVAVVGCVLLSIGAKYSIAGVIFINFWHVLDCTDGNIARVKREANYMGEFIDAMSGYIVCSFVFLSLGLAAYHSTTLFEKSYIFIIIGGISSIAEILTRLIHQRYTVAAYRYAVANNESLPNIKSDNSTVKLSYLSLFGFVRRIFGFSGLFMPLLIVALIINLFDYLSLIYAAYQILGLIAVFIVYLLRAQKAAKDIINKSVGIKN